MPYFRNYLNLEIVWHTALSSAQYLKLNLLLRAEICSSTVHMPNYLQISWYVSSERAPNIFKRALLRANIWSASVQNLQSHEVGSLAYVAVVACVYVVGLSVELLVVYWSYARTIWKKIECTAYITLFFICFSSGATKVLTKNSSNLSSCKSVPHTDYNHTMLGVHQDIWDV